MRVCWLFFLNVVCVKASLFEEFKTYENIYPTIKSFPAKRPERLEIKINAFKANFTLILLLNKELFKADYFEKSVHKKSQQYHPVNGEECYYHGYVDGDVESMAGVSYCDGVLSGYFMTNHNAYHIHPPSSSSSSSFSASPLSPFPLNDSKVPKNSFHNNTFIFSASSFSSSFSFSSSPTKLGRHYIFRNSDSVLTNFSCGYSPYDTRAFTLSTDPIIKKRPRRSVRWPYDSNDKTLVVELYVAVDHTQYITYDRSLAKVVHRTKEIVNLVSSLFRKMNIYVALVGIEVWTEGDLINIVPSNADDTMNHFLEYRKRKISPLHHNDNAQLIMGKNLGHGVVGKAPILTICTLQYSGGVNLDHSPLVGPVATTLAHEMGHNFGLTHDNEHCQCPDSRCIMASSSGGLLHPTQWSLCSKQQFEDNLNQGMHHCLHNIPDKLLVGHVCGNGFLEEGEQCDCGLKKDCTNKCCNAENCTLVENATCATGKCCNLDTCMVKKVATECRRSRGTCDVAEYCSGISEFCPEDVHVVNGHPCITDIKTASYCYKGTCASRHEQCKVLWGEKAVDGDDACYVHKNVLGNEEGNCGSNWSADKSEDTFVKCLPRNARCGLLHCQGGSHDLLFWKDALSHAKPNASVGAHRCKAVYLDVGLRVDDPGMVPDGVPCADDMMCVNRTCIPASSLSANKCPYCHGNGICNSLHQCHCSAGFSPPFCSEPGHGGSYHSNPVHIQQTNTNALIVLFVLIIIMPIIILFILLLFKHKPALCPACLSALADKYIATCGMTSSSSKKNCQQATVSKQGSKGQLKECLVNQHSLHWSQHEEEIINDNNNNRNNNNSNNIHDDDVISPGGFYQNDDIHVVESSESIDRRTKKNKRFSLSSLFPFLSKSLERFYQNKTNQSLSTLPYNNSPSKSTNPLQPHTNSMTPSLHHRPNSSPHHISHPLLLSSTNPTLQNISPLHCCHDNHQAFDVSYDDQSQASPLYENQDGVQKMMSAMYEDRAFDGPCMCGANNSNNSNAITSSTSQAVNCNRTANISNKTINNINSNNKSITNNNNNNNNNRKKTSNDNNRSAKNNKTLISNVCADVDNIYENCNHHLTHPHSFTNTRFQGNHYPSSDYLMKMCSRCGWSANKIDSAHNNQSNSWNSHTTNQTSNPSANHVFAHNMCANSIEEGGRCCERVDQSVSRPVKSQPSSRLPEVIYKNRTVSERLAETRLNNNNIFKCFFDGGCGGNGGLTAKGMNGGGSGGGGALGKTSNAINNGGIGKPMNVIEKKGEDSFIGDMVGVKRGGGGNGRFGGNGGCSNTVKNANICLSPTFERNFNDVFNQPLINDNNNINKNNNNIDENIPPTQKASEKENNSKPGEKKGKVLEMKEDKTAHHTPYHPRYKLPKSLHPSTRHHVKSSTLGRVKKTGAAKNHLKTCGAISTDVDDQTTSPVRVFDVTCLYPGCRVSVPGSTVSNTHPRLIPYSSHFQGDNNTHPKNSYDANTKKNYNNQNKNNNNQNNNINNVNKMNNKAIHHNNTSNHPTITTHHSDHHIHNANNSNTHSTHHKSIHLSTTLHPNPLLDIKPHVKYHPRSFDIHNNNKNNKDFDGLISNQSNNEENNKNNNNSRSHSRASSRGSQRNNHNNNKNNHANINNGSSSTSVNLTQESPHSSSHSDNNNNFFDSSSSSSSSFSHRDKRNFKKINNNSNINNKNNNFDNTTSIDSRTQNANNFAINNSTNNKNNSENNINNNRNNNGYNYNNVKAYKSMAAKFKYQTEC